MQNLPITAIPPASPAQQAASADSNATQPAEAFSNVLARQRANASTPNTDARDSKQAAPSSAGDAAPASGDEQAAELQALAPDTASTLPNGLIPNGLIPSGLPHGEMLPALLPVPPATNRVASDAQPDPLAPAPDAAAALAGDMLVKLLPASATTSSATANETSSATTNEKDRLREPAPDEASTLPGNMLATLMSAPVAPQESSAATHPQPVASGLAGKLRQSAIMLDDASSLSRTQGDGGPAAIAAATAPGSAISAALDTMSKNGSTAAQPGSNATELSVPATQPGAPGNLAFLAQNGMAPVTASPNGPAQAAVNIPVTHEAWGNEFGQKVTWLATQHAQSAELHLNPPQLGPLDIVLNVSGDQATALFTSPHAAVRDAVEQALPRLREMLADSGITLGNATVSDQSPKEQQAWLTGQQQNGSGNQSGKGGSASAMGAILSGDAVLPVRRHQGMVDTFA